MGITRLKNNNMKYRIRFHYRVAELATAGRAALGGSGSVTTAG
jgi:hypothetical protein